MRLVVVSHKPCWPSPASPSGYATDGGFPLQMDAISQLFDATTLVVPCGAAGPHPGEVPLAGRALRVAPLVPIPGSDLRRKLRLPLWLLRHAWPIWHEVRRADAVHTPIPGDIGTLGMFAALVLRKPLFVRHCGNWTAPKTTAEKFWRWLLERIGGERAVVLATGGAATPPSARNAHVRWIFSTSLTERELGECATPRLDGPRGPRLAIACRQEEAKGTGVVIEALPALAARFPAVHFDVVGDGSALPRFRALAEARGVADRVTFHGKLDHDGVLGVLRRADVFCFPTWSSEGFPKAVLEALACGLPVVTTDVSVLGELVGAGGGVVIGAPTAEEVARAVTACVESTERYRAMSEAGVRTARAYSLERWRDTIGEALGRMWGPLRTHA